MKSLPYIIAVLAVIIAVAVTCQGPEDQSAEVSELKAKVARRDQAIHEKTTEYIALRTRMRQDSILLRDTIKIKEKQIVVHESNIKRLRSSPKVIEIVRENPVIDTIFQYYDSVGSAKDMIIYSLTKENQQLYVDVNEIERNFTARLDLQAQNLADEKQVSESYRKQVRKERRMKRLAIVLVPVIAVGAFLLGSQL
jgi:phosphate uptake regulator